ncbi:RagB/SusD family nutrient uptake outer membrane protein [Bacteroides bouchesdurhonensis]|uniref:RagB/SusD family nutrient uptake outer membrane protein n=1 Tax=Bacteroides bouchesdurhonensis TaxID=1841855 RepID=UPI00097F9B72|nr:RagB/SusD family nutrient uptake outer membrane protein [Bacteroides bouchesdurhonensis]
MRTKYIILTLLSSLVFASCNYLDFDETNNLKTKEDMYKYFDTSKSMLTYVYSFMPQGCQWFATSGNFTPDGLAMRDCASDDGEFGAVAANIQNTNNGNWSAIKTFDDSWSLYKGIRAANSFIAEIAQVDFTRYEHNAQYTNWMKQLKYFPYEARVLRAHYFFELARRYGDIAMPLEVLTEEEANTIGKTSFNDVIDFIVSECDEAIADNHLPDSYVNEPNAEVGRVTKGFAMAVKSKALLYAASKLHNPSMNTDLWKKSAKAALDIINTGLYSLDPKESANNLESKETVLMRINDNDASFELFNFPIRFTAGKRNSSQIPYSNFPSQNLVDAFETVNGYKVTLENTGWVSEDPEFDPQLPYDKRDKRFYLAILANGMQFQEKTIETYKGGADDGIVSEGGSPTGYFLRKYIQEGTLFTDGQETSNKHHWVIYRYAETLLTYAESMVNAFNDVNYTDDTYKYSALWAINEVRKNAGMPAIPSSGKDEFLERLYNEWRVEFAFEDHRFWDVRRWKIADSTQRELYGVKIEKQPDGTFNFYKNLYETRNWRDAMYLYPIPQSELYKNANLNPQNTGW